MTMQGEQQPVLVVSFVKKKRENKNLTYINVNTNTWHTHTHRCYKGTQETNSHGVLWEEGN